MKEWKERFEELFVIEKSRKEKYSREYGYITIVERLEDFIEQEIERVEQEAYERGVQDGMKEKVYDKKGKSSCCGADVYVGGKGPTLWYVCDKCGNPCDWVLKAKK